jgi:hypothetical protein
MRLRNSLIAGAVGVSLLGALYAFEHPRPWVEYPGAEYENFPIPPDYRIPGEWTFARLMYPAIPVRGLRGNPDWQHGRANWTIDYPRSDRHLSAAIRRLTRIQVRSVEQCINPDDGDEIYYFPFLYAVEVGYWALTDSQVLKLRDYLLRGGFFMCDDFHGTAEWEVFNASMKKVFPDRQIVNLQNSDQIFHTIYDLGDRYQVPGEQFVHTGLTYEHDGYNADWKGIYDDKGRLMVAICHNMDLGDSWEHADNPEYPAKFSDLGLRIGVNYVVYAMTH